MSKLKFYKNKNDQSKFIVSNEYLDKKDYIELKANTFDAATEKHIPVYIVDNDKIIVTVGSCPHPMTQEHYIMWIALVHDDKVDIVKLNPNDKPTATFDYIKDSTIYAYCNLHSLWKKKVD